MSQHIRNSASTAGARVTFLAALLACTGWSASGTAAEIGHSRLVSGPGAPLQAVVPVIGLTADEADSLQASVAPESAWIESRMAPPVPLAGLRLKVEDGPTKSQRVLRVHADTPPAGPVIDLLLDVSTATGKRRVQVSFLAARSALPTQAAPIVAATRGSGSATQASVTVRRGDTLIGIARRHAVADATLFQMLVALWQANPKAFIGNNMNLVRADATLVLPDAATVRAIDPRQARQIYLQHVETFQRGRGANGNGDSTLSTGDRTSGAVGEAEAPAMRKTEAGGDRVRLSSAEDAAADERTSAERAAKEADARLNRLQDNVDGLNRAAGQAGAASGTAGGQGGGDPGRNGVPGAADGAQGDGAGGAGTAAGGQGATGAAAGAANGGASGQAGAASADQQSGAGSAMPGGAAPGGAGNGPGSAAAGDAAAGGGAAGGAAAGGGGGAGGGAGADGAGAAGQSPGPGTGAPAGQGAASGAGTAAGQGSASGAGTAAGAGTASGAGAGSNAGASSGASGAGVTSGGGAAGPGASASSPGDASGAPGSAGSVVAPGLGPAVEGPGASPQAAKQGDASSSSWWADNLLVIVTGILAVIAFIIAWAMRRAGARQDDDRDDDDYGVEIIERDQGAAQAAFQEKLERIDLDLDDDGRHPDGRRR